MRITRIIAGLQPGAEHTAEVGVRVLDRLPAGTERVITAIAGGRTGVPRPKAG